MIIFVHYYISIYKIQYGNKTCFVGRQGGGKFKSNKIQYGNKTSK